MGNKGLLGLEVPEKYQGLELTSFDSMRIMKQLGSIDTTLSLFVGLTNVLGVRPILKNAQEEVKENILPIISKGRELGAFALSEDGAGSNPLDLQMSAIPTSNKTWILNGKKIWSGASAWAGVINTFAKEYDENGKLQGFTAYCVRQGTKGLVQGGEALTVGMRGLIQNTIYFNDVEVNELNILGQRGKGMDVAQDAMMYGRLTIASACIGGMKRCLQFINNYSSQRKISTGLLIDNAVTRKKIYEISNFIVCIDVLVNKISKMIDQNLPIPQELYVVCKILAPEYFWISIDHTIQILGGRGYVETNLIPQMMRDARVLRIFEGPTETLSMYLGSKTINVTNSIYDLIVNVLGCSDIFEKLEQAIETVLSVKLTNKSSTDEKQLKQIAVSEFVCLSILESILLKEEKSIAINRALDFVNTTFELKLKSLECSSLYNSFNNRQDISELINSINDEIGQIEQNYPIEEKELDPLLKHVNNTIIDNIEINKEEKTEDLKFQKLSINKNITETETKTITKNEYIKFDLSSHISKFSPNKIWIIFTDNDNKKIFSDFTSKNKLNNIIITSQRKMTQIKDDVTGEMIVSCQTEKIDFETTLNKIFDENGLLFYEIVYLSDNKDFNNISTLKEFLISTSYNFPKKLSIITNNSHKLDSNISIDNIEIILSEKDFKENLETSLFYKDIDADNKNTFNKFVDITFALNSYNVEILFKLINSNVQDNKFIILKDQILSVKTNEITYKVEPIKVNSTIETISKNIDINTKPDQNKIINQDIKNELIKIVLVTILGEYQESAKDKTFLELGLDSLKAFEVQHELSQFLKRDIALNESIIKMTVEKAVENLL